MSFPLSLRRAADSLLSSAALLLCLVFAPGLPAQAQERIPATEASALDGHTAVLPRDLPAHATVLILGFGRNSAEPTTAWEKAVRTSLEHPPETGFLDMPVIASAPKFVRSWIVRAVRNKVPEPLRGKFIPLSSDEDAWKRAAGYDRNRPDAPYVLLVDRTGTVQWKTAEVYTPERLARLAAQARALAAQTHEMVHLP